MNILNRPGGFEPAGTADEFIRGFQVFDKEGDGFIGQGELKYVLTSLGEKLTEEEVDELLQGVKVTAYASTVLSLFLLSLCWAHSPLVVSSHREGNINYVSFVHQILGQVSIFTSVSFLRSLPAFSL